MRCALLKRVQMRYALLRTVENVKKGSDALRAVEKVKKGRYARNCSKLNSKFNKMFCSTDLTFGRVEVFKHELS